MKSEWARADEATILARREWVKAQGELDQIRVEIIPLKNRLKIARKTCYNMWTEYMLEKGKLDKLVQPGFEEI